MEEEEISRDDLWFLMFYLGRHTATPAIILVAFCLLLAAQICNKNNNNMYV